ncbi:F-box/kelch-repeat protein [Camellia lanceoleosa]|uniref:F-box/kelch-repeat protein n=1 Tax=Camellia lanceoleosa TaxID=1840588 RepID=A0ACC0HBV3_9ERIC|nr:F-box/kelch-repeat protein [Camellia lanceoleosa]
MTKQSIPNNNKKKNSIPKELPSQIILEILSRLPIKTLFLCQLVSKHWLSLISDPHFVNLHLSRSPVSLLLKPFYRNRRSYQLHLVDLQTLHKIHPREAQLKLNPKINFPLLGRQIVNSCNGLLCLCYDDSEIFVCNPILGDYIVLPWTTYDGIEYHRTVNALGFSPKTNQYKVIRFFLQRVLESFDPFTELETYRDEAKAKIYTIGEGLWRNIGSVPYYLTNHSFNSFVNGALHWLNFARDSPDFICCFDFGSEQFRVVPEPPEFGLHKEFHDHIRVGVLQDCLSICDFSSPLRIDIWLMKDYGIKESWSKELVIENGIEFYGIAYIPSFVSLKDVAKGERLTQGGVILKRKKWVNSGALALANGMENLIQSLKTQRREITVNHVIGISKVSIGDCVAVVRSFRIDPFDPRIQYGVSLMDIAVNREMLMSIPTDEGIIGWLKAKKEHGGGESSLAALLRSHGLCF